MARKGLYANIHAKRKRGGKMYKKGGSVKKKKSSRKALRGGGCEIR